MVRESTNPYSALEKAREQVDDNGQHGKCGNWEMSLGGYDLGYEIYYKGEPVARVNYEDKEYELYRAFVSRDNLPAFLQAIDAVGFKNVDENGLPPLE